VRQIGIERVQALVNGEVLSVGRVTGDPTWFKDLMVLAKANDIRVPNLYGYDRAYATPIAYRPSGLTVPDPTAGGGSIPFEALRLGHTVIANELNPVAAAILYATLDYPARFGCDFVEHIKRWGEELLAKLDEELPAVFLARLRLRPTSREST
jgi:putative DNA methylase